MNNKLEFLAPKNPLQILEIHHLYIEAFPQSERKPFGIILRSQRLGKTDICYFKSDGKFIGFATMLKGADTFILDYLAVRKKHRSSGFGTAMLTKLRKAYCDKGIIVEIEDPFSEGKGLYERQRRREFYLRCGFSPTGIMVSLFGVDMEILCTDSSLTPEQLLDIYHLHYGAMVEKFIRIIEHPTQNK